MAQTIASSTSLCPLCGQEIDLKVQDWRIPSKWRSVIEHRDKWALLALEFREQQSIAEAANRLAIDSKLAAHLLDFLCTELCGCRAVTCVSCLDDYRSEL